MVKTSKIWWKFKISTFWRKYFLLWLAFHHDTSPCRSAVIPGLQPFSLDSKPDRKRDLGTLLTHLNTPRHHSSITRMILKKISKSQNFVFFHHFCLMVTIFSWSAHISFTPGHQVGNGRRVPTGKSRISGSSGDSGEQPVHGYVTRYPLASLAPPKRFHGALGMP